MGIASDPGADRADRRPHAGGRRRPARAGLPGQARAHALLRARQRLRLCAAALARRREARALLEVAGAHELARRAVRHVAGPALEAIVAFGAEARAALELWTPRPDVARLRGPASQHHDGRGWSPSGGRRSRAARGRDARIPTATRPCPTTARASTRRLRGASRRATCRSGCRRGSATTRGGARPSRATTTPSSGPAATSGTRWSGGRPTTSHDG